MLDQILKFLNGSELARQSEPDAELNLAIAALLIEAAKSDGVYDSGERYVVTGLLRRLFGIGEAEAGQIVQAAEKAQSRSAQLFQFTQPIIEQVPPEQRVRIVEMLWETVYSDRILTAEEDSLVRRVAGLLYVSDRDRGEARLKVLKRLGIQD